MGLSRCRVAFTDSDRIGTRSKSLPIPFIVVFDCSHNRRLDRTSDRGLQPCDESGSIREQSGHSSLQERGFGRHRRRPNARRSAGTVADENQRGFLQRVRFATAWIADLAPGDDKPRASALATTANFSSASAPLRHWRACWHDMLPRQARLGRMSIRVTLCSSPLASASIYPFPV